MTDTVLYMRSKFTYRDGSDCSGGTGPIALGRGTVSRCAGSKITLNYLVQVSQRACKTAIVRGTAYSISARYNSNRGRGTM